MNKSSVGRGAAVFGGGKEGVLHIKVFCFFLAKQVSERYRS